MRKNLIIRIMGQNKGGGAERHIYQVNQLLIKNGWEVITYIPEPSFKIPISHCDMVNMNYIHNINFLFLLKNIWQKRDKIVFIHSHLRNATVLAGLIALILCIPHVVTIHGRLSAGEECLRDEIFNSIVGFFLCRAKKVIFISRFVKKIALKQARQKTTRINSAIVYNGSGDISDLKHTTNSESNIFNICVVGQLTDTKNMSDLIWLTRQLNKKGFNKTIRINLFGEGPWQDRLQKIADETGILVIHGYEIDTNKIFHNQHLHLILSRVEGFGRVVTEAMARAIPTLCFNSGAFPELLTNNTDGFLVETKEDLLTKLMNLIQNKHLLNKVGNNSRKTFLKRFTVEHFQQSTYKALSPILKS